MIDCPPLADLEEWIARRADAAVSAHVSSCPRCEATITGIRANLVLAEQLRGMLESSPAPEIERPLPPALPGLRILHALDEGAQGVVYKAIQESTRRPVAIKFLHHGLFSTARQRRRFEREIDLVASLRHPGIVTVHESGTTPEGQLYCVMEFVDGSPIDEFVRSSRASVRDIVLLFSRVCQAVHHAHRHGVLHRDLKPSNVFVDRQGEPRVLDFGLARELDAEEQDAPARSAQLMTRTGEFLGTFAYASPEQLEADPGRIDVRSDVYSLGVILYELLAGRRPYEVSSNVAASVKAIQETLPAPPSQLGASCNRDVDTIVLRALAKDRERRYESAADFGADLQNWIQGRPIDARRDSAFYVLRKTLLRHWLASASIALVCLVSLSAAVISNHFRRIANAETARAGTSAARAQKETQRANETAEREREQAGIAERKARESERVRALLEELITANDPARALGRDPTVREVLDGAGPRIVASLQDEPLVQASLQLTLARAYLSVREPARAEPALEAALETYERQLGSDHLDTLHAASWRLTLLLQQARYEEAEGVARDVLARLDNAGLGESRLAAGVWSSFSSAAFGLVDVPAAIERAERQLAILESTSDRDDIDVAEAQAGLAIMRAHYGQLEPAEELMKSALATLRLHADECPALLVHTLLGAQELARMRNDHAASLALLSEAHELCTRMYGPADSYTLRIELSRLEAQWRGSSFWVGAPEVEQALKLEPLLVGRTDREALTALVILSNFAAATDDRTRAERLARFVIDTCAQRETPNDVVLVSANVILGSALALQGRFVEAEPVLARAVELGDLLYGSVDRAAHNVLALLACCRVQRGDDTGLVPLVERAMARVMPIFHETADLLLGEMRVAEFLFERGHRQLAEQVARHVVEGLRARQATHLLVEPLLVLASVVREQGRFDEALDLAYRARDAAEEVPEGDGYWVAAALVEIGANLRCRDRLEEAEASVLESLWIFEELGAPDRPHHLGALRTLGTIRLQRGDFSGAETPLTELRAIYRGRQPAESRTLGVLLCQLGKAYLGSERFVEADEALREAHSLLTKDAMPDAAWSRSLLDDWIVVHRKLGNTAEVERLEQLRRDP